MFYRPLLPNGKELQLPWQIKLLYFPFYWPIKDDATLTQRILDKFIIICGFLTFIIVTEAEFASFLEHIDDIEVALEALATCVVTFELTLRLYWTAFRKHQFKEFIKEFYWKIYVENESINSRIFGHIQRNLKISAVHSYFYIGSLLTYFIIPVMGFMRNARELPFRMSFLYDYTPWPIYIPTLLLCFWIGTAVVSTMIAEFILLVTLILHLNARYLMLQEDVNRLSGDLLKSSSSDVQEHLAATFNERLVQIVRRNLELRRFSEKLEKQYTFQIFTMLSLSAILLCILAFEVLRIGSAGGNALEFAPWMCAKTMELVVLGKLGSVLFSTTDSLSTTYYCSNWEDIILNSPNTVENVRLMKLIRLTIALHQKPFCLTGLNFFTLSLETVVVILKGSGSYFTFLCSMR